MAFYLSLIFSLKRGFHLRGYQILLAGVFWQLFTIVSPRKLKKNLVYSELGICSATFTSPAVQPLYVELIARMTLKSLEPSSVSEGSLYFFFN